MPKLFPNIRFPHQQDFFPIRSVTKSSTSRFSHENLVEKFKIFGQDFVPTRTALRPCLNVLTESVHKICRQNLSKNQISPTLLVGKFEHDRICRNGQILIITQFRTRVFVFQFFSVQGGNSTDVKIHSSEVKMYSADVKIQVKIRNQKIAI